MKLFSKFATALLFAVFFTGNLFSQVPKQTITGADSPIPLGDIVFLGLSKIEDPPKNLTKVSVSWKVIDNGVEKAFREMQDGSIFFGSGITKRKVTVFASVSYLLVDKKENVIVDADVKSNLLSATVTIGESPFPPPPPPPDNPDDPTFPDGKYKLSSWTYKAAKDKVPESEKINAKILAESFKKIALDIKEGKFTKLEDVLAKTTELNREKLAKVNGNKDHWDSFFTSLQEEIYGLYKERKMTTILDFEVAWNEIAAGLDKVSPARLEKKGVK